MLGAAQADALGAEVAGLTGVAGSVGIGAHEGLGELGGKVHDCAEVAAEFGFGGGHLAVVNFTGRAVERDPVAFVVGLATHFDGLFLIVNLDFAGAGNAALAHTAGNHSSVRGHTAAHGEDTLGHGHAAEVFGRGLDADEDNFLFLLGPCLSLVGEEHDLAGCCAGRCGKALGNYVGTLEGSLVEYRVEQFVELLGLHTQQGGLFVNLAVAEEVHGDFHHSGAGALAVTGLEHPQLAVLDGEFHILHVAVVIFEAVSDGEEFLSADGHGFFERGIFRGAFFLGDALKGSPAARAFDGDLLGSANTGHNVLTLCVDEVFTVEDVFAGGSVARESHAGGRVLAHVAVYHGLHVYSGAPFFGNLVHAAVDDGAFVHPRVEHGADAAPELFPSRVGEVLAGVFLDGTLEEAHEGLEVFNRKFGVEFDAFFFLHLLHDGFEGVDVGLRLGLHAEHHVAVHLHETTVGVPGEAGVAALFSEGSHGGVIHAEVEHGVHHAGHGCAGTRANRHEQGIGGVVKFFAGEGFDMLDGFLYFLGEALNNFFLAILGVFSADIGGDGEAGRYGHSEKVHLGEVGTLAAEEVSHLGIAFGLAVTKCINSFHV